MVGSIQGPERRIVLMGRFKSGKSATGNTILGRKVFEFRELQKSRILRCQKEEAQLQCRKVVVLDTPGFSMHRRPDDYIAREVSRWMNFCSLSTHIILHVIDPFFCSKEMEVAQRIKEIFSHKAKDYTIILFTWKDYFKGQSLENVISSKDENLKEYIAECGNRYMFFNNKAEGEEWEAQVAELMTMIDALVERNRDAPITPKTR